MSFFPRASNYETHNEEDCAALLAACWKHRGEYQTQILIGEWSGLTQQRVSQILLSERDWGKNDSILAITACKYGYEYKIFNRAGNVIDVVLVGRVTDKYD